jgi:SH3 domain-containing protein
MKIIFGRSAMWVLFLVACTSSVWAQQGTANRNVILRRDPSTSSPALEHLPQGARVTLVDASPDSGFYHVRTEDDQVGWVFSKYINLPQVPTSPTPTPGTSGTADTQCDVSLWSHVYHSQRLIVKQQCIAVTGTIVDATGGKRPDGVRKEKDGDTHGWLKVDSEFQNLLNTGNVGAEGGNLVFEIVCKFPVTQTDAKVACQGFTDHVTLPPVGSHVRIVGTYVQDTFHAQWMEIHPVTSITVIP